LWIVFLEASYGTSQKTPGKNESILVPAVPFRLTVRAKGNKEWT
jgi:hypothetical protein